MCKKCDKFTLTYENDILLDTPYAIVCAKCLENNYLLIKGETNWLCRGCYVKEKYHKNVSLFEKLRNLKF